jgi:hypothetical protein
MDNSTNTAEQLTALSEDMVDTEICPLIDEYKKLSKKCDVVIAKIKTRKNKKNKMVGQNG